MKLSDRVWLGLNRKAPVRWSYYSTIFFEGFATGVFLFVGLVVVKTYFWFGLCFFAATVFLVVWGVVIDSKRGYVDALHKKQVELWNEKRRKLGVK